MVESNARVLAGRYEVGELIGRGGMAEVRIGRDNRLSRRVAVKLLRSDLAQDSTFQARFRREAQSAAALNHPAIVSVYDTGEDNQELPDGTQRHIPFIVMEYVEGHTVRELLRDGAALPIDEAVEITEGVLSALEYSHHAGIVHRDIKPANVMITTAGDVKVMDFGIARAVADSAATMTQTQAVVGTAQYLSPEQARGEVVDARSDVYSTGALLFELLTGRPPFMGDSPVAVAYQHVREEPPTPSSIASDVPEELDRIVLKALAKDRTLRYQSAAEFRADLEAAQRGGIVGAPAVGVIAAATRANQPSPAGPTQVLPGLAAGSTATLPTTGEEDEEADKRGKAWIWVLSIVAVLLLGGIAWAIWGNRGAEPVEPPSSPSPSPTETTPEAVEIPDVSGRTVDEARRELEALGLTVLSATESEASDTVAKDLVIRTSPDKGQMVQEGEEVTLVVSSGPSELTVPNVIGNTESEALEKLKTAGFTGSPVIRVVDSPDQQAGRVVSIDPGVDSMAAPDQTFSISVASGNVPVPDLTGLSRSEAEDTLKANKLFFDFQPVQSTNPEGTVVEWEPTGTQPQGTTVTVYIATPPPSPPPTPTETPSSTPTESGDGEGDG
ncbi:serine/threonine-protein kinase [Salana multivorans]|uniref:non-specific serine/threonine protein kinase n=1 Tax=Salana multivorans TaxID=120377 RepID=A0A3N2DAH4_9MICO|nr:Stk1 family PASTA domain-containing Ser/Thr kinase [Salana multivorans]OJX96876.1 MAG: serine/threonine protein kinase [Micrococcales bacterium 73-15]ROR96692.1 serine/threonine-protein kinase [Salana multivorans]